MNELLIISGPAASAEAADMLGEMGWQRVVSLNADCEKAVFVADMREKSDIDALLRSLAGLNNARILYMENDASEAGSFSPVRERADVIFNTSGLTPAMLRASLFKNFGDRSFRPKTEIKIMSFGYKYAPPPEAELVFDVRFLPNPYYVAELRPLCGLDKPIRDFVFSYPQSLEFMQRLRDMVDFLIPLYAEQGKFAVTVALGCTGGRHRSVCLANELSDYLKTKYENVELIHREGGK